MSRRPAALVALLASAAAMGSAAAPAGAAGPPCAIAPGAVGAGTVVSCDFTGGEQSWTAPPGVTEAAFDLSGAQGGSNELSGGGLGARAQATIAVTPGDVYEILVGGVGTQAFSCVGPGAGGYNGGGAAGTTCDPSWLYRPQGMGGGGASDVRHGSSALADRVIVAAGGGGAAMYLGGAGGAGGAPDGLDGSVGDDDAYGRGATQLAGGAGAVVNAPGGASGADGALGVGGAGGPTITDGGGGGGGGLYGGGGGGSFPCVGGCGGDGGGGGGSSYGPPGTTFTAGVQTGVGRVQIDYTTVNPPPTCDGVSAATGGGSPVTVTLACQDPSGVPLTYEIVSGPAKGSVGPIDQPTGQVAYTPSPGQNGADTFSFRARSVNGSSATATATIALQPPPACTDVEAHAGHDTAVTVELSCSDPAADELTYALASQPADGSLGEIDQAAGTVVYTPDPGFSGSDQFAYTATSVNGTSQQRLVEVAVDPPPPTCSSSIATTTAGMPLPITLSCDGTSSFPNTYALVGQPQHGELSGFDEETGDLTYTPQDGFSGQDSFTYSATNAGGPSSTVTVTIDVTPPLAPTCSALSEQVDANGSTAVELSCATAAGFPLTYATVGEPAHGTLSDLDPDGGTVAYTPDVGYSGADSFTYNATNTSGTSSAATVTMTVGAPPPPTCEPVAATNGDAGSLVLSLDCTGATGFPISRAIASGPEHGTLSELDPAAGTVRYTPDEGFGGIDTFSFEAANEGGDSEPADASIAVLAPPVFDGAPGEGSSVTTVHPSLVFSGGLTLDGFECRVDDGGWSACSSPFTVPDALAHGEHTVAVRSRGDGGEVSRPSQRTFVVDDDPPGGGGAGGTGGPGDGGGAGGAAGPGGGSKPAPSNRFAFPQVSATRAGALVARFAFPRGGDAVLTGTLRSAHSPFTAAGALDRRSAATRRALFTARTVRSTGARTVTVRLALTARGRLLLRREGRVPARLWVSFKPTGGTARATSKPVVVAVRLPRR
ncbi:MAG TPA: Ig-like domain-containing protein [Conexibacter sp.]|jgi:hypothetical protein